VTIFSSIDLRLLKPSPGLTKPCAFVIFYPDFDTFLPTLIASLFDGTGGNHMAKSYLENLLGERERVLHIAQQHWIILLRNIAAEVLLILLFFTATVVVAVYYEAYALPAAIIGFILILIPMITMTRDILTYTNNQFVITNRRVIHLKGIVDKNTADSSLEKVNDVLMVQSAMGRLFNYGDVEILTASELGVNKFRQIGDPVKFKTAMLNAKQALEDRDDLAALPLRPTDDIPALLAKLGQLRVQGVISEDEFQAKKAELLSRL
jgi:hypothetical protein